MLQRLLIRHDGRRALVARLGAEAEDGIDALLDLALAYERVEPPSLTGFLDWLDRDEVTVKRRMEEGADQVRVMTVHGAKGLEAPIVILPDTAQRSDGQHPPQVLRLDGGAVWRTRAEESPPLFAEAEAARRAAVAAENRRLLYVALTRAGRWLIVAGAGKAGPTSWHTMVSEALDGLSPVEEPGPDGPVRSLSHRWAAAPATGVATPAGAPVILPGWARTAPPMPAGAPPPFAPSSLGGAHALPGEGADEAEALARGAALHLLLEALPPHPRPDWPGIAARLLGEAPGRDDLLAEAEAVLDAPDLAHLFGPGTLAEVEVTAPIKALGGRRLAGRIDRLVVTPGRVLAVDFKSNRVLPGRPEDIPEAILRQLGAYAAALAAIWPGHTIATAVLWTRGPALMHVPPALAAAALARAARLDPAGGGS
jgi:ATP-dependent helicase/nuclease subunit A